MIARLDHLYDREERMIKEWMQLQEDKELLQTIIMHQYNKMSRFEKGEMR